MRRSSVILTCLGAAGVIGTSVLTAKATPKAVALLQEAEVEKGEALTTVEKVKVATPSYIPSIVMGAATIACIFGANTLSKRSQASLASAYALLERSYREYQNKVKELYGEEGECQVKREIMQDKYEELDEDEMPESDEVKLFFDFATMQYFRSTMNDVIHKEVMDDGLEVYMISTPYSADLYYGQQYG